MEYPHLSHYDIEAAAAEEMLLYGDGATHYGGQGDYILPDEEFEADFGNAEFQEAHTILADGGDRFGVSAIAFDQQEELVWMGNQGGHVTSYVCPSMQKYTSFQVHANQEVRHIHTINDGILVLTQTILRCQMRRGIPIFTHTSENMVEMQCQLQISPDTILMGGHQEHLIQFNLALGQETGMFHVGDNGCAILREHGRYICAGDPSGRITLHDPSSLRVEHTLEAHSGSLSDFDVHGNQLVTCGFSNRHGSLSVDRFFMVYDLRMMRAVSPIQVLLEPLLLRFLPSFSSRLVTVSALGQMQLLDTVVTSNPNLCVYQLNTAGNLCLTFDVSTSGQCLGFGDGGGSVHLYTSAAPTAARANAFSRATEFADVVSDAVEPISMLDENAVLAAIPLPYCQHPLLSDWPEELTKKVYRRAPKIDPDILRSMKVQGTIGYAPNPNKTRRNQVGYKLEKHHGQAHSKHSALSASKSADKLVVIPKRYRKQEVKYSKSGMEDFDMDQYNKTSFSGLEATLPNSYCNPMLQVLYYMSPIRQLMLSHVCHYEFCLSCELGFLFHMLDISQGFPCQPSNFLRAFRTVPEASAAGLVLSDSPHDNKKHNIVRLIQCWNKFILQQTHYEILEARRWKALERQNLKASSTSQAGDFFVYKEKDFPTIIGDHPSKHLVHDDTEDGAVKADGKTEEDDTAMSELLGMKQTRIHKCLKCQQEVTKDATQLLCNLIFPDLSPEKPEEVSFNSVLLKSICPEQVTPAWCNKCAKFQPTLQSRRLKTLPDVLAVNCGLDTPPDKLFWQTQTDLVMQKVADLAAVPDNAVQGKPCRYGATCSRPTCRFSHGNRPQPEASPGNLIHLYYANSWLPMHLRIDLLAQGGVNIERLQQPVESSQRNQADILASVSYDLTAVVCYINDDKKNLVAMINVSPEYHQRAGSPVSQWYIFNDLTISPIPLQEVVWFSLDWKVPCVLYWTSHAHATNVTAPLVVNPITLDVFGEDKCLARNGRKMITFTPLAADEMPGRGDIVAMDAEFVTLNQEEAELRSDGKMSTIKPSHMSVARITCIRGFGSMTGTPFIDDYISTQEEVVDYLTKFSGIKPGDLDANFSSKHLTTLKSTYQKLRFLIDNGVVFLGHGLKNDFRVINLVVPTDQIIDTVLLYHLPHNRMISLRFLAWHFLGLKIQAITHDSIEDARTALQLYQCYKQFEVAGVFKAKLKELYEVGKRLQWKIPGVDAV